MEKNEIITLSSDEETDCTNLLEHDLNSSTVIQPVFNNYNEHLKLHLGNNLMIRKNIIIKSNKDEKIVKLPSLCEKKFMKSSKESPEFVDLVESVEKTDDKSKGQFQYTNLDSSKRVKQKNSENHSKLDIIEIEEITNYPSSDRKIHTDVNSQKEGRSFVDSDIEINENDMTGVVVNSILRTDTGNKEGKHCECQLFKIKKDEDCNQNLKFFTEFVDYCGSLEKIPNDRARLTKKLMKRYGEADSYYIKSQEFKNLIQKCKDKVNWNNLYLIAKEVTDELSYRKKIEIDIGKSVPSKITEEKSQTNRPSVESNEKAQEISSKKRKKRSKIINQIITKLDKLGNKIRELEKKEVDLSDEEESSYVQLQRYRERFCQIYKKLCKYTSEVANPDTIYNPKICFTESKYPAINKCIEIWLNKTKRFPDFSDILKLLESQSSSLGLPSSRESVRTIATEIFQQVGAMLQRKRIYDLWDSLCEFLGAGEDPASNDPTLDQVLKSNFEARIKKEQEIFQHFSDLQEKERLEPEEVPDEEANRSPVESGSEDDKELEDIENSLHRKLDDAIKKETEGDDKTLGTEDWDGDGKGSGNGPEPLNFENSIIKSKESKNNFRNCKSLKWRSENCGKTACLSTNSEDSSTGTENEKEKGKKSEMITVENFRPDTKGIYDKIRTEMIQFYISPTKRVVDVENENPIPPKKKCTKNLKNEENECDIFEFDDDNDNLKEKTNGVFNIHCCQFFADNVFEDLYEKKTGWKKRKVFRDLTNVNRLMEVHGKRKKISGLYSPSFFHRSFLEFEKSSWKKRFKVSFKLVGLKDQRCALNQKGESGKKVKSHSGGDTEKKNIQNNSETGRHDEGDNFFSGHGNGSEGDDNEDKNKKNGKPGQEINDNQFEEDDNEENDDENDDNLSDEAVVDSFQNQKVVKRTDTKQDSKTPLKSKSKRNERVETIQQSKAQSETLKSESTNKVDDEKPSEKAAISAKEILKEIQKNSEEKVELNSNKEIDNAKNKISQNKREGDLENYTGKLNMSESEEYRSEKYKFEVKTLTSKLKDEEESVEVEELKPVGQEKGKKNDKVIRSETASTKTEQQPENLMKVKNENHSTATDDGKEIVSSGVAEEAEVIKKRAVIIKKAETLKRETVANKSGASCKTIQLDLTSPKPQKRSTPSTSDEERVKRFLLHSPSSISITPPRKLSLSKPPSQAALQALATLRNLKGISATIVKGKPKNEDEVVVIGGSFKRQTSQESDSAKRRRSELPVISSVQSIDSTTPKIVTVQGNVSGFDNSWQETPNSGNTECNSSSIRISNVWGNLPNNFMHSGQNNESVVPGCSSQQTNPGSSCSVKKKNTKKAVEYVVLE